jgi:hypothetical protein
MFRKAHLSFGKVYVGVKGKYAEVSRCARRFDTQDLTSSVNNHQFLYILNMKQGLQLSPNPSKVRIEPESLIGSCRRDDQQINFQSLQRPPYL